MGPVMENNNQPPAAGQAAELTEKEIPNWANWALLQAYRLRTSQGTPVPETLRPVIAETIVDRFGQITGEDSWKDGGDAKPVKTPRAFIVIATGGMWGKGNTLEEAAKNSKAGRSEKAFITVVLNATMENVWVDSWGTANSDAPGSVFVNVGKTTIGGILSANK